MPKRYQILKKQFDVSSDSMKIKMHVLMNSEVKNYLESQERLFISSLLKNLENDHQIKEKEIKHFQEIYNKYRKYFS
ncbi:MAG: hypothetical protein DWQ18_04480 [Crenarchaeota archaeon]|nr:MAG: hypothetical protein DWQ17_08650 [Thermoproteota archaeon]RDJ34158.1 MAG: hypothetical protein DWQ18_04480 [Thermoproteota archaeon]RDJ36727.1 MAG: hypothetical protein DWQ13_06130 [Thermoproteota archaeon]RDJ37740.1 MAG: hypothetical protein DWQ19_04705 [Thermoproteota archaeon]